MNEFVMKLFNFWALKFNGPCNYPIAIVSFYSIFFSTRKCFYFGLRWFDCKTAQFLKEAKFEQVIPPVKIDDGEGITYKNATDALRRAVSFYSALQSSDGHWPAEITGTLFFLPPLVCFFFVFLSILTWYLPANTLRVLIRDLYSNKEEESRRELSFLQVFCFYITGHLEKIFDAEHRKEMLRHIYCHQVLSPIGSDNIKVVD